MRVCCVQSYMHFLLLCAGQRPLTERLGVNVWFCILLFTRESQRISSMSKRSHQQTLLSSVLSASLRAINALRQKRTRCVDCACMCDRIQFDALHACSHVRKHFFSLSLSVSLSIDNNIWFIHCFDALQCSLCLRWIQTPKCLVMFNWNCVGNIWQFTLDKHMKSESKWNEERRVNTHIIIICNDFIHALLTNWMGECECGDLPTHNYHRNLANDNRWWIFCPRCRSLSLWSRSWHWIDILEVIHWIDILFRDNHVHFLVAFSLCLNFHSMFTADDMRNAWYWW